METSAKQNSDLLTKKQMPRGTFLKSMALAAGGLIAFDLMAHSAAAPGKVSRHKYDKQGLITETVYFEGTNGYMESFLARPDTNVKLPGLLLLHENRGLNNHSKDMAKRAAMEGYCVLAPDALSPVGGTIEELDENKNALKNLDERKNLENYDRALRYLADLSFTTDNIGGIGFCWGAGVLNRLIVRSRYLKAAVSYYGHQTPVESVKHINVPLFLHYAEEDDNINKRIATFLIELLKYEKDFKVEMHKGVDHYFNNPLYKNRYDKKASKKAWEQSFSFLSEKLAV